MKNALLRTAAFTALAAAFATSPVLGADGVATLGSPPPDDEAEATAATSDDPMDGLLDYAACMREHGVDMPDPQTGGGGFVMEFEGPVVEGGDPPTMGSLEDVMGSDFIAADEACSHHLGAMVSDRDPALEAELMEQMLAHAQCMREHGVEVDDPDLSGGRMAIVIEVDPFSEDYMVAEEACREILPFGDDGVSLTTIGG